MILLKDGTKENDSSQLMLHAASLCPTTSIEPRGWRSSGVDQSIPPPQDKLQQMFNLTSHVFQWALHNLPRWTVALLHCPAAPGSWSFLPGIQAYYLFSHLETWRRQIFIKGCCKARWSNLKTVTALLTTLPEAGNIKAYLCYTLYINKPHEYKNVYVYIHFTHTCREIF